MQVNNISFTFGGNYILKDVNFNINPGEKIGLIGKNGTGKTTLLRILVNELALDSGNIDFQGKRCTLLKQEIESKYENLSILEYLKMENDIDKYEKFLNSFDFENGDLNKYDKILEKYLRLDGYNFEEKVKKYFNKLKLKKKLTDKIKILSGGEKAKVLLTNLFCKMQISYF